MAPVATAASDLANGTIVAGYRIERELGRGAMAVVYRAIQLNLERPVALKVLTDELAKNEEFVSRFFNEARAAAQLSHPNIVQAYDAGVTDGNVHYFAMEYVEGETLLNRILREGFLRPSIGLWIALDIGDALDYGWQNQTLTHGDIKPENIMLNSSGQTKLADFGLAKVAGHDFEGSEIMLTPLYAAPELIRGKRTGDCRADIYSFGATLYHMFAGVPPYPGDEAREVMRRHVSEPLTPLNQRNPAISKNISDLVGSLLEKSPDDRPQDWEEIKRKLKLLEQGLKVLKKLKHLKGEGEGKRVIRATKATVKGSHTTRHVRAKKQKTHQAIVRLACVAIGLLALLLFLLWQILAHTGKSGRAKERPPPASAIALTAAEKEWRRLKEQLSTIRDPAQCLELLEGYQRKYSSVPGEFRDLYDNYSKEKKWRKQAMSTHNVKSADGGKGAAAPPDPREQRQKALLEQMRKAEDEAAPSGKGQRRPGGRAEKGADKGDDAAASGAAVTDDYLEYVSALARFKYGLGSDIDPLVAQGAKWLAEHPGGSPEAKRIEFVVKTLLPSLEEFVPKLVLRKEKLIGTNFPGRKYANEKIRSLSLKEILLDKPTEHGKIGRRVSWSELDDPRYFIYLGKEVFDDKSVPLAERRPYLAFILMTGSFKYWEPVHKALPETPEKRLWTEVGIDLEKAPAEGEALELWRQACGAFEKGEMVTTHRLLERLKSSHTAVAYRHRDAIARMEKRSAGSVPGNRAGEMVRKAQGLLSVSPADSLALLNTVVVRYGNADFPEKSELDRLRDKAVAALPSPDRLEHMLKRPFQSLAPFVFWAGPSVPAQSMMVFRQLTRKGGLPDGARAALPSLRGLALLEMGDWRGGADLLLKNRYTAPADAPPSLKASLWFGLGLVADRYEAYEIKPEDVLKGLRDAFDEVRQEWWLKAPIGSLIAEYAMLTRQHQLAPSDLIPWTEVVVSKSGRRAKQRFVLGALAWMIESGRLEEALAVIDKLVSDKALLSECEFSEDDVSFFKGLGAQLRKGKGLVVPQLTKWRPYREHFARVLTSAVLSKSGDKALADEWSLADLPSVTAHIDPVSNSVSFDLAVGRAVRALAAGKPAGAAAETGRELGVERSCFGAFFPRLCFLKAGLHALVGEIGPARETLGAVQLCTVANESERLVAQCLREDDDAAARIKARLKDHKAPRFWYMWLLCSRALGAKEPRVAERALEQMKATAASGSEKRLADATAKFLKGKVATTAKR